MTTRGDPKKRKDIALKYSKGNFNFSGYYGNYNRDYFMYPEGKELEWDNGFAYLHADYNQKVNDKLNVNYKAYYNFFNYPRDKSKYDIDILGNKTLVETAATQERTSLFGVDINTQYTLNNRTSITGGVNYEKEDTSAILETEFDMTTAGFPSTVVGWADPAKPSNSNLAFYMEALHRFDDKNSLSFSGRYDDHDAYDAYFSPSAAFIHKPNNDSILKVLFGRSFRAPSYRELYVQEFEGEDNGNPDLQPEFVETYEVNYNFQATKNLRAGVAVFTNEMTNMIYSDTVVTESYQNLGEAETEGMEIDLDYTFPNNRGNVFFNMSKLFCAKDDDGNRLEAVADKMFNVGFNYKPVDHSFNFYTIVRHVGRRNRSDIYQDDVEAALQQDNLGSYTTVDFALNTMTKDVNWTFGVYNAFDK